MMIKRIYRLLRPITDPAVDRAMAEALPTADAEAQHLLVLSLLERRDAAARMALVQYLHLLSPQLQQLIVAQVRGLDAVVRAAAEQGDPTTRLNVVDVVTRSQSFRLAYLLSAQLHHDDSRVRRAAAAGLLNIAQLVEDGGGGAAASTEPAKDGAPAATKPQRVRWLTAALLEGCACYHQHGRQDVLAAAAALGPARPKALMQQLTDRRCAAHAVLRDMIRQADRPEIQAALLTYASLATLEPAVVESLSAASTAEHLPTIWRSAHLLAVPDVRSAVRKVTRGAHLLPTPTTLTDQPAKVTRLLPRWVLAVRVERAEQAAALHPLADAADNATRLLALRALREVDDPAADEVIAALCFDQEPAIARMALRHLKRRQWVGLMRLTVKLVGSPHASVRALAERELAPVGFERLWRHWDQMDASTQQMAGRAVLKIDRRFQEQLAQKLGSAHANDRFKAVMLVRRLELAGDYEQRLIALVEDADPRVASSAAKALGMVEESSEAVQRLGEALEHEDDRVRANAIESLESLGQAEQLNQRLRDLTEGAGNRTRATAIRALMKLPVADAMPELTRMLHDERPEHRASALWVVQQTGVAAVARQVVEMARQDADREIRRRALEVYKLILDEADSREPATTAEHG